MNAAERTEKDEHDYPGPIMKRRRDTIKMLTLLIESGMQISDDLCGEQRDFHVPRITKAMTIAMGLFPTECVEAMQVAKDPYGKPLVDVE